MRNTVDVANAIADEIALLEKNLPAGVHLLPFYDQSELVRQSISSVRDAIHGTAPLAIPAEDGYRTIRLLELALQSSNEKRTMPVTF